MVPQLDRIPAITAAFLPAAPGLPFAPTNPGHFRPRRTAHRAAASLVCPRPFDSQLHIPRNGALINQHSEQNHQRDGRWAAFEIKLGKNKFTEGADSLRRLKEKIALNPAAENPNPAFMAVFVGAGEYARFDKDTGIYVIPITALGK